MTIAATTMPAMYSATTMSHRNDTYLERDEKRGEKRDREKINVSMY